MKRLDVTLLMLGLAGGQPYQPVQIQKSLFLIGDALPHLFDADSKYQFKPYDYGPFDKAVYEDIRLLEANGFAAVSVTSNGRWNQYCATDAGQQAAERMLEGFQESDRSFLRKVSEWVRGLSFSQLVSAIYKAYPEMKVNSIFVE